MTEVGAHDLTGKDEFVLHYESVAALVPADLHEGEQATVSNSALARSSSLWLTLVASAV